MNAVAKPLMSVRSMEDVDVPRVMAVEGAAYDHPWTEGIFLDCLRVGYYCVVGEIDGDLWAHAIMSEAVGEAHVLNLCIHPQRQGEGFGRRLLEHLIAEARARGASHMFLEVRLSNQAAQSLYLSMGFNEIAQRPSYYPAAQGREAALVYAKTLQTKNDPLSLASD